MNVETIQEICFGVIGGLGLFLLGMKFMSDGLQTIAGPGLKRLIAAVTGNRIMACGIGVLVTCLVQSSSVTSVMTLGFVNSGIMNLSQSIGILLGANVGTTITGWILVLKVGKWGLPILGVSAFVYLFNKNERWRYIALAIMGIGLVFFGLETMKGGVKVLKSIPEFDKAFLLFQADSFFGILKCAAIGCFMTVLIQSSSATLGITIALASQGMISFETAAALVLGENIGTTITAFLASLGANINARRAAYFHIIFNVLGCVWIISIFRLYLPFVKYIVMLFFGIENVEAMQIAEDGTQIFPYVVTGIAATHTIFNVANMLLFLPFTSFFSNILTRIVKEKEVKEKKYLTHLDYHHYESPFAALKNSENEIICMKKYVKDMLNNLDDSVCGRDENGKKSEAIFEHENLLDTFQKEITEFLTELLGQALSAEDVNVAKQQLRLADEYESISDEITQVIKLHLRMKENNISFTDKQKEELSDIHNSVSLLNDAVVPTGNPSFFENQLAKIIQENEKITQRVRSLRDRHWDRLTSEMQSPLANTSYMDILQSYRRLNGHLVNIVEALAGEK